MTLTALPPRIAERAPSLFALLMAVGCAKPELPADVVEIVSPRRFIR